MPVVLQNNPVSVINAVGYSIKQPTSVAVQWSVKLETIESILSRIRRLQPVQRNISGGNLSKIFCPMSAMPGNVPWSAVFRKWTSCPSFTIWTSVVHWLQGVLSRHHLTEKRLRCGDVLGLDLSNVAEEFQSWGSILGPFISSRTFIPRRWESRLPYSTTTALLLLSMSWKRGDQFSDLIK